MDKHGWEGAFRIELDEKEGVVSEPKRLMGENVMAVFGNVVDFRGAPNTAGTGPQTLQMS